MIEGDRKKKCGSCSEEKSISEYANSIRGKDGLNRICRSCYSEKYYKNRGSRKKAYTSARKENSMEAGIEASYKKELAFRSSRKKRLL